MAAVVRAMHLAFESPVVFADPFAKMLTTPLWRIISSNRLCYLIGTKIIYPALSPIRRQILARARYAEDQLEKAVAAGIDQYVIIGAGLDSFAVRRKDLASAMDIYELDHPASQRAKQRRLKQLRLSLTGKHHYIPVDFEKKTVGEALAGSLFDPKRPGFFSWLGTVHYLSEQAVYTTLESIAGFAQPGSEIVFDYAVSEEYWALSDLKMAKKLKRFTSRRGEVIVSMFDPVNFPKKVSKFGYELLENLSPKAQAKKYFTNPDGSPMGMPGSYFAHFRLLENRTSAEVR